MTGCVFDIKEFGLHDGSGLRTTVFLKGCPLRCQWCHNPEGQSFLPEIVKNEKKCVHCGLCGRKCDHESCKPFGVCLKICPNNCVKAAGEMITPELLAEKLRKNGEFLRAGGVTFSGGEPLCQTDFILETVRLLPGIRTAAETCGFVPTEQFLRAVTALDDVMMDLKLMDPALHKQWTGQDNALILANARALMALDKPVTFRVPLIPGVTDTDDNLSAVAKFVKDARDHVKVELIPYNRMTGAKYRSVGRVYEPAFEESRPLSKNTKVFLNENIRCEAF